MIQRINLIERAPFQMTYQKLVLGGVGLLFFCMLLWGSQWLRIKAHERKSDQLTAEITRLKEEREKLLKSNAPQWSGGPLFELHQIFEQTPPWSHLLQDLGGRLPGTVWLTGFRGFNREGTNAGKAFVINGLARNANNLSEFLKSINESSFVSKAMLTQSKKETTDYNFSIECDIADKQL